MLALVRVVLVLIARELASAHPSERGGLVVALRSVERRLWEARRTLDRYGKRDI